MQRVELAADLGRLALGQLHMAQAVEGAMLGHLREPRGGVVGYAVDGPLLERGHQRVLRQLFGQAHIAHLARERGDDLRGLDAPDRLDGAVDGGGVWSAAHAASLRRGGPDSMRP
ncbi:hypothetical protein D9M70_615710 [compost metagenome]